MMLVPPDPLVAKKTELVVWIESRFSFDPLKSDANDDQIGGKTELGKVIIGRA